MSLRGLTIIVATDDGDRFRAALTTACASAALGHATRVYFHERAVALVGRTPVPAPDGLPDGAALMQIARDTGIELIACQTGLGLAGLAADVIGVRAGGMVDLLATIGKDRLVAF